MTLHSWEKGSRPVYPTFRDGGPLGEWRPQAKLAPRIAQQLGSRCPAHHYSVQTPRLFHTQPPIQISTAASAKAQGPLATRPLSPEPPCTQGAASGLLTKPEPHWPSARMRSSPPGRCGSWGRPIRAGLGGGAGSLGGLVGRAWKSSGVGVRGGCPVAL